MDEASHHEPVDEPSEHPEPQLVLPVVGHSRTDRDDLEAMLAAEPGERAIDLLVD